MRAADQWVRLQGSLEHDWAEVRLAFTPEGTVAEAAAVLAPLQPGRVGGELRFDIARAGSDSERLRNLLERLDRKRVWGTLALLDAAAAVSPADTSAPRVPRLAQTWDDALGALSPGWSDLICELELDSSDHVPRAALLGAPLNPTRNPEAIALRFRVSGKQGYGASPGMARRCFERMDADGITGRITVLGGLSDTDNVVTQGPVWRIAGRSV